MDILFSPVGLVVVMTLVVAGAIQGSTGYGFGMLAAPILAIVDPQFVPGPMLAMAIIVSASGTIAEWRDMGREDLAFSLFGRLVASSAAAYCVGVLSESSFQMSFGIAVLMAVILSAVGLRIRVTRGSLVIAGAISGFMGTLTSIGSPPMAIVYQNASGPRMRATLNAFFVIGGLMSLAALALAGRFGGKDLLLAVTMVPFAFAGFLFSKWGRKVVDRGQVKTVTLVVSSLSAAVLIMRALG